MYVCMFVHMHMNHNSGGGALAFLINCNSIERLSSYLKQNHARKPLDFLINDFYDTVKSRDCNYVYHIGHETTREFTMP